MKWTFLFLPILIVVSSSCETRKREEALQQKEADLKQKEQELLLKETTLQLKEEELLKREQRIDSASNHNSTPIVDTSLTGSWSVKMTCTETSCTGYAIGDTKSETWHIAYEANTVMVKAMSNNQLVRVYTGSHTNNGIELIEDKSTPPQGVRNQMIVRLRSVNPTRLEGRREIVRDDCKVIYTLQLEKESRGK